METLEDATHKTLEYDEHFSPLAGEELMETRVTNFSEI